MLFNYNGNFCAAKKKLTDQATKAMYALYRKLQNVSLLVDLQLKLFDSLISPILTYSSEVWGFENSKIVEKIHLQFCKKILKIRNNTPSYMVYGELGRFPMEIIIKLRMVSFWNSLLEGNNRLSSIIYNLMLKLQTNNIFFI